MTSVKVWIRRGIGQNVKSVLGNVSKQAVVFAVIFGKDNITVNCLLQSDSILQLEVFINKKRDKHFSVSYVLDILESHQNIVPENNISAGISVQTRLNADRVR